jgi:hypothetical protein
MRPSVVASLAAASALVAAAAVAQSPARSCVRVEVSNGAAGQPVLRSGVVRTTPTFSATRVLDLTLTVLFPARLPGEHVVELRVLTPDGQLYRSMAVPFARGAQTNAVRSVLGYARPLPQQALKPVGRGSGLFASVSTTLPVGGTDIVSAGLYGRWQVEAYLDGAEQQCGPPAPFTLAP